MTSVRWLNLHPKTVNFEQHWDIEIVKWLLSPKPWTDDYAESTQLHRQGSIVVIPGRFHDQDLERINELIRYEPWVVYVITSDEETAFDVDRLEHPNRKVWVQTPRPGKHDQYGWLPVGWTPHTFDTGYEKTLDWYFAGQITHSRRLELAAVLRGVEGGWLVETQGFTQGLPPGQYIGGLASARVAPCPSGPLTPDTFRLCEALELGCIPVVETQTPKESWPDYWPGMFGVDHPLPVVESWYEFPGMLAGLLADWPRKVNEVGSWWIGWKRDLHRRFWADVRAVGG